MKWKTVLDYILYDLYVLYLCAYGGLVKQKGRKSSRVEAQQSKLLVCDCVLNRKHDSQKVEAVSVVMLTRPPTVMSTKKQRNTLN